MKASPASHAVIASSLFGVSGAVSAHEGPHLSAHLHPHLSLEHLLGVLLVGAVALLVVRALRRG